MAVGTALRTTGPFPRRLLFVKTMVTKAAWGITPQAAGNRGWGAGGAGALQGGARAGGGGGWQGERPYASTRGDWNPTLQLKNKEKKKKSESLAAWVEPREPEGPVAKAVAGPSEAPCKAHWPRNFSPKSLAVPHPKCPDDALLPPRSHEIVPRSGAGLSPLPIKNHQHFANKGDHHVKNYLLKWSLICI